MTKQEGINRTLKIGLLLVACFILLGVVPTLLIYAFLPEHSFWFSIVMPLGVIISFFALKQRLFGKHHNE